MKKKITVVALGFVLAGSAAAQASALTSLASYRQQNDSVGREMPVSAARIFSVDEGNAPPILDGFFFQIIDKSMTRTTPGKMRVAENQAVDISVKGSGISTIADREIFYKTKMTSGGTDQLVTGGSISLINEGGSSTVSSSTPYTVGNITIRSAGNLVVFENGLVETMVRTGLSGLSGGTGQFFTGGSISLINTDMSTSANISVPVFSDIPVLPAGSLDLELTAMNPSPVPLPAAVYLLGSGMALLFIGRRRNEEV
ncbi:MAG: hypothetical protein KKE83_04445 [Proteobacteria bacterium]|nr:hypothetical protein [Pseudomonadota bacterium]MBU1546896.1 hypothetical protein [Pseudomonadota bacterium]MBU2618915.1 hypothetical protein [Pseudomonadota bacterium]